MPGFMDALRERYVERDVVRTYMAVSCSAAAQIVKRFGIQPTPNIRQNGLLAFHDEYPSFPVRLEGHKLEFSAVLAFKDLCKTPAFKLFRSMQEESARYTLGLVFRGRPLAQLLVLHNWVGHETEGAAQFQWRFGEERYVLESLQSFVEAVKAWGWTP